MSLWSVPWLDLAILFPLIGSLSVRWHSTNLRVYRWLIAINGATLACVLLEYLRFKVHGSWLPAWSIQRYVFGTHVFSIDELSAPLVLLVEILNLLSVMAIAQMNMKRFAF